MNEIDLLRREFSGESLQIYPFRRPVRKFPPSLIGAQLALRLIALQKDYGVNHIYFPTLYAFPVLRLLKRPIVWTVSASLDPHRKPRFGAWLKSLHRIVVSNDRDAATLHGWGYRNYEVIPPGIATSHIVAQAQRTGDKFTILLASAPWHKSQFDLKGVDAILEAARSLEGVHFIFLWRGLLIQELRDRVDRFGVGDRVTIINEKRDINDCFANADAAILLTKRENIVKAYPHSLVESLAANRPVILSETIPMADYVRRHDCGVTVETVAARDVVRAVTTLRSNYACYVESASRLVKPAFPIEAFITAHRQLYANVKADTGNEATHGVA